MAVLLYVFALIGLLLSAYALHTEKKASEVLSYKAICDIRDNISCTKAFTSPYGKLLGMPNSIGGLIFYALILILVFLQWFSYVFYLAILAFLGSVYLAYISYAKLKNYCVVCTAIYVVNILLLVFSYLAL